MTIRHNRWSGLVSYFRNMHISTGDIRPEGYLFVNYNIDDKPPIDNDAVSLSIAYLSSEVMVGPSKFNLATIVRKFNTDGNGEE